MKRMKYDGTDKYNRFWPASIYLYTIIPMIMFFCKVFFAIFFHSRPGWQSHYVESLHKSQGCIKSIWLELRLSGSLGFYPAFKFGQWKCIQHIGFCRPATPGGGDAVTHQAEALSAVSVGSDSQLDARFDCHPAVNILQVQPPRICIDLQRGMRVSGVVYHSGDIEVDRLTLADQPARRVIV